MNTIEQFDQIIAKCKNLFERKTADYRTAWRILRLPSLTDQIYIKASRVRTIQELGSQKVEDNIADEFIGIINYSIMALIQLEKGVANDADLSLEEATDLYEKQAKIAKDLLSNKNHDYGEAWREMRVSSITDLILQKLLRIKQIEDNNGKTIASEGLDANYLDMINYSIFALILINENK